MGTEVGGLSSIAYDADTDRYYVISDDQSVIDPARYYTLALDVDDGNLDPGDVVVTGVTTLLNESGLPFPAASFDPEGLAPHPGRRARHHVGGHRQRADPAVGAALRARRPPARRPARAGRSSSRPGARRRRASARTSASRARRPSGRTSITGSEGALVQDGPAAGRRRPQPGAAPALQPEDRPARPAVRLLDRSDRPASCAADELRGRGARRAARARQALVPLDGALVLRRRARHGEHDQALHDRDRRRAATSAAARASPASSARSSRSRRRCCSTWTRSASRSTTSRA